MAMLQKRKKRTIDSYAITGFIAAGTYGRVFKAKLIDSSKSNDDKEYAIKKFKPDKDGGDPALQSGISQSACREISLCRELRHINLVALEDVMLDSVDRSIYMVFEYAEHDLLQILHFHSQSQRKAIPDYTVKSLLWQLLNGVAYLHNNWVLHRDLKPANVLVTSAGVVKIGDLGLARGFQKPLQPLFNGDKVVVTIWYRAPELLLGSRHYTKAVDIWAVGCIFAELLMLRPIFKGEEAKMDNKKNIPFQRDQLQKIFDVLGTPTKERWPSLEFMPEYSNLSQFRQSPNNLRNIFRQSISSVVSASHGMVGGNTHSYGNSSEQCFQMLQQMLEYDPLKRISATDASSHPYFQEDPKPHMHSFSSQISSIRIRGLLARLRPRVLGDSRPSWGGGGVGRTLFSLGNPKEDDDEDPKDTKKNEKAPPEDVQQPLVSALREHFLTNLDSANDRGAIDEYSQLVESHLKSISSDPITTQRLLKTMIHSATSPARTPAVLFTILDSLGSDAPSHECVVLASVLEKNGDFDGIVTLIDLMKRNGLSTSTRIYNSVIRLALRTEDQRHRAVAEELFNELRRNVRRPSSSAVIGPSAAVRPLPLPDRHTEAAMLRLLFAQKRHADVVALYEETKKENNNHHHHHPRLPPTAQAHHVAMASLLRLNRADEALEIFAHMTENARHQPPMVAYRLCVAATAMSSVPDAIVHAATLVEELIEDPNLPYPDISFVVSVLHGALNNDISVRDSRGEREVVALERLIGKLCGSVESAPAPVVKLLNRLKGLPDA